MNFDDLTNELSSLYYDLKTKKVEPALAHELNNTALNIQGTIRLALLDAKLRNSAPDLAFFKSARKAATKKSEKKPARKAAGKKTAKVQA